MDLPFINANSFLGPPNNIASASSSAPTLASAPASPQPEPSKIEHRIPPTPSGEPDWATVEAWIEEQGARAGTRYIRGSSERAIPYRRSSFLFRKTYPCHCAGTYESTAGTRDGKKTRQRRKPSKKLGCTSAIVVKILFDLSALILYDPRHVGHVPGSEEEIRMLSVPREGKRGKGKRKSSEVEVDENRPSMIDQMVETFKEEMMSFGEVQRHQLWEELQACIQGFKERSRLELEEDATSPSSFAYVERQRYHN
ncbi:hypothetical protein BC937DRAFT_94638 [Endogone sp. FLAS-F59071]|nr:hypothetical protein BC937DRAFT_94638 [Endogone sp. FLAS-F59071]|eukprot:RUS13882.1 hypothetical protein BC937DRAFT_94638 [Endogone sp. FLAS-F59071]